VLANEGEYFAPGPAKIALVSPLADGADQIAAEAALAQGFSLEAVLPFGRADYGVDFDPTARTQFDDLLARATSIVELPGTRASEHDAYLMAGRATLSHSDLLIAVWDGQDSRGIGGTAEIVQLALVAGQPIIHVSTDADTPVSILWSGFDPHVVTTHHNRASAERPFDAETLDAVLTRLLAPPEDPCERGFLKCYFAERERRLLPRIEYPLMLALTGVRRFSRGSWRAESYAATTSGEWLPFHEQCVDRHGVAADIDPLEQGYSWADLLARHFAQSYRSGHVFNFLVGAFAVVVGLTHLLWHDGKMVLAILEFGAVLAVIVNTRRGRAQGWHRRWLDYRQLAERLRPMRSFKLLGLASPDGPGACASQPRWTDWYAGAMWRAMGSPTGRIAADGSLRLAHALSAHELAPQIAYHRDNAEQVELLDHRLHLIGTSLFVITILNCIVLIVGYVVAEQWTVDQAAGFIFLSAGLPALGTAIFGIRVQGDFSGTAARSRTTAQKLEAIVAVLAADDPDLSRASDLFEQASRAMLAELSEWRLAHQQHDLVIPA